MAGHVNFALGQVKMEVCWSSGQAKLGPVSILVSLNENVSLINDDFWSEAFSKLKSARLVNH